MSQVSRRSALLAVPASATLVAAGAANASAAPLASPAILTFTARRTKVTIPNVPPAGIPLGSTYIALLDLFDKDGAKVGDGSVHGSIVDILVEIPPKIVVQAHAIFRFPSIGEIHTTNMHIRQIPNPGVRHFVAITGGTGDYRTARGSGTIEHVHDTDTLVVLNVMVDPPPAAPGT